MPIAFLVKVAPPVPMTMCTVAEGLAKVLTALPLRSIEK